MTMRSSRCSSSWLPRRRRSARSKGRKSQARDSVRFGVLASTCTGRFRACSHTSRVGGAGRDYAARRSGNIRKPLRFCPKVPATSDTQWVDAQRDLVRTYQYHRQLRRLGSVSPSRGRCEGRKRSALESRWARRCCCSRAARGRGERLRSVRAGRSRARQPHRAPESRDSPLRSRRSRDRDEGDSTRFIDIYNNASGWRDLHQRTDLAAVATAIEYLGTKDPQLFKDALKAFDRALQVPIRRMP